MTQQNRETLLALADRIERATGRDARLGAEIQIARGRFPERAYAQRNGMRPKGSPELDRIDFMASWDLDPTASLDAAVSLVPEGRAWGIDVDIERFDEYEMTVDGPWSAAYLYRSGSKRWTHDSCFARTPALALCAASLRATASYLDEVVK